MLCDIHGHYVDFTRKNRVKSFCQCRDTNGLLNTPKKYFSSKTYQEVEKALTKKFGSPRNPKRHQQLGNKSFFNLKTERSFNVHTDPAHGPPHVDVKPRSGLKKKYLLKR